MENDDKANVSSTRIRITLDPYVSLFYNEEIWILNFDRILIRLSVYIYLALVLVPFIESNFREIDGW